MQRDRDRRTAEILETGVDMVRGGEQPTMRGIAARMGMTAPALMRYVPDAAELRRRVAATVMDDLGVYAVEQFGQDTDATRTVALGEWYLARPAEWLILCEPGGPCADLVAAALAATGGEQ